MERAAGASLVMRVSLVLSSLFISIIVGTFGLIPTWFLYLGENAQLSMWKALFPNLVGKLSGEGGGLLALPYLVLFILLLAVTVTEARTRTIPHIITLPGLALGLLFAATLEHIELLSSVLGAAGCGIGLFLLSWVHKHNTGEQGLGGGVKWMFGMLGAFLGFTYAFAAFIFANIAILVYLAALRVQGKPLSMLEIGPWLAFFGLLFGLLQLSG